MATFRQIDQQLLVLFAMELVVTRWLESAGTVMGITAADRVQLSALQPEHS